MPPQQPDPHTFQPRRRPHIEPDPIADSQSPAKRPKLGSSGFSPAGAATPPAALQQSQPQPQQSQHPPPQQFLLQHHPPHPPRPQLQPKLQIQPFASTSTFPSPTLPPSDMSLAAVTTPKSEGWPGPPGSAGTADGGAAAAAAEQPRKKYKAPSDEEMRFLRAVSNYRPPTGARKIVVKNLRNEKERSVQLDDFYRSTWMEVTGSVQAMLHGEVPDHPYERLYRGVEDLCRHGESEVLAKKLNEQLENHMDSVIRPAIWEAAGQEGIDILKSVYEHWQLWNKNMRMIRSTFCFLDQSFLSNSEDHQRIDDLAIQYFRQSIFSSTSSDPALGRKFVERLCGMVQHERTQDARFDEDLFKDCIALLKVLGAYEKYFEPRLIRSSHGFFLGFSKSADSASIEKYVHTSEELLDKETERWLKYGLDGPTMRAILQDARILVIENNLAKLVEFDSLARIFSNQDTQTCKSLFGLLRQCNLQGRLREPWRRYVLEASKAIIGDPDRPDDVIPRLVQLRQRLDFVRRKAFVDNDEFFDAMQSAFRSSLNEPAAQGRMGEMMAKHLDVLLREGLGSLPPELRDSGNGESTPDATTVGEPKTELEAHVDSTVGLLCIVQAKDVFEASYHRQLARRLLLARGVKQESEYGMLAKLRDECSEDFIKRLQIMLDDLEQSRNQTRSFGLRCRAADGASASRDASSGNAVTFDVKVLTSMAWPGYPELRLSLPDEIASLIERYDKFYKSEQKSRTLAWKLGLSTCVVRADFPMGTKELCVSAQHAAVLLLFNKCGSSSADDENMEQNFLTYDQIAHGTNMEEAELKRTLQSLACGRVRVLAKHPRGRDVSASDTFTVNEHFSDTKRRIKISQIQLREAPAETSAIRERVDQDRRFEIQATVVRVMKSRKSVQHAALVAEVIDLTRRRGAVQAADVKREIDTLLEKDYIERDDGGYVYIT